MTMKKCLVVLGAAAVAVLLTTSAFAQARGTTFTPVGFTDEPLGPPASSVLGMDKNGTEFIISDEWMNRHAVLWTREGGWAEARSIGFLDPPIRMSQSGETIMSNGLNWDLDPVDLWPGTWQGVDNMWEPLPVEPLPFEQACDGNRAISFYGLGGEGECAVGLGWVPGTCGAHGWIWYKATDEVVDLGSPNERSTRANAVSNDCTTVIGWSTSLSGPRRAGRWDNETFSTIGDPNNLEPKACVETGKPCTASYGDPVYGCPEEFVDDGTCPASSKGTCTAGVCVGGFDAGNKCTSSSQCGGTCSGGPNAGLRCVMDYNCPDTPVCVPNPLWTDDLWKGEAFDITGDGQYVVGRNFDYGANWDAGFRSNPDGTFTKIAVLPDFPFIINPGVISDNGLIAAGHAGGPLFGFVPFFWNEWIGTIDLQKFLIGQGLDELYFWYLLYVSAISEDGLVLGGQGVNPDGLLEGFIVDMHRVVICHKEADPETPEYPESGQTTGIAWRELGEHITHGDELGSCEFLESGGLARADGLRQQLIQRHASLVKNGTIRVDKNAAGPDAWAPMTRPLAPGRK